MLLKVRFYQVHHFLHACLYLTGVYLEQTAPDGNLIRGWEGLLATLEMDMVPDLRYKTFKDGERVFSKSSKTSHAAVTGEDLLVEKSR